MNDMRRIMNLVEGISYQDPDHAPGAVDREAAARDRALSRDGLAVHDLNNWAKSNNVNVQFSIGKHIGMFGDFIIAKGSPSIYIHGKTHEMHITVSAYEKDLIFYIYGYTVEDLEGFNQFVKKTLSGVRDAGVTADRFGMKISFGAASNFGSSVSTNSITKILDEIKEY